MRGCGANSHLDKPNNSGSNTYSSLIDHAFKILGNQSQSRGIANCEELSTLQLAICAKWALKLSATKVHSRPF